MFDQPRLCDSIADWIRLLQRLQVQRLQLLQVQRLRLLQVHLLLLLLLLSQAQRFWLVMHSDAGAEGRGYSLRGGGGGMLWQCC